MSVIFVGSWGRLSEADISRDSISNGQVLILEKQRSWDAFVISILSLSLKFRLGIFIHSKCKGVFVKCVFLKFLQFSLSLSID